MRVREHTLAVTATGQVEPHIILAHSTGMGAMQFNRVTRALAPRRCLVPDFTGYGASSHPPLGTKDWTVDRDALKELALQAETPVDLIGHSYGGFLVLQVAREVPQAVRRVLVHEPVLWGTLRSAGQAEHRAAFDALFDRMLSVERGGEAWLEGFVDFWSGPGAWSALTPERAEDWRRGAPLIAAEVHALADDPTPHTAWAALPMPVCVTYGEDTVPMEKHVCSLLSEALPNATLVGVAGGHMAPVTHARAWLDVVQPWVARDGS